MIMSDVIILFNMYLDCKIGLSNSYQQTILLKNTFFLKPKYYPADTLKIVNLIDKC